MEGADRDSLARFAREHHVHYELAPEALGPTEEGPAVASFRVRLFATPGEKALQPPGSRPHVELLGELRSFAERLIRARDPERAEVVPTTAPALYASTEVPGADDVELTVRVRCGSPEHRADGGEDRCIGDIRRRLDELGVPRR